MKIVNFLIFVSIWFILTGIPEYNLFSMSKFFFVPFLVFFISNSMDTLPKKNVFSLNIIYYVLWLFKEIIFSSIEVIKISLRRNLTIQPVLQPIKSGQKKDMGVIVYANSITLTPGTVTLSVEKNFLLVHALDIRLMDQLIESDLDSRVEKLIKN